jgi:inhibitor of KinA
MSRWKKWCKDMRGPVYRVYMIGFLPGFPYMGTVDPVIATQRKREPSLHIAKGSVGIAGMQTGIYPLESPGGWNIIGRTPLDLFDPQATPTGVSESR